MSNRNWSLAVIGITCFLMILVMAVNYVIDPLQFYRKAFYAPDYSDQQRYQNPGLAKNYDYDTVIIGSSMSENHIPSYVNQKLGVKTLKLSIMGSSIKEQQMITQMAIDTGKAKNVIWVIDYFGLRGKPDRVREDFGPFPYHLYDKNPVNDVKYLLNIDTLDQVFHLLKVSKGVEKRKNPDLDKLNTWSDKYSYSRDLVLKDWEKWSKGGPVTPAEYELDNVKDNIDQNILSVVKKHPEVNFYLYYPPYSILQHRFYYEKSPVLFENELISKRYIFDQVGQMSNVHIFDFQGEKKWTFDLNNYKDLAHHSGKLNMLIIDAIAENKYRVNKNKLDEVLNKLKRQVETLDVTKL